LGDISLSFVLAVQWHAVFLASSGRSCGSGFVWVCTFGGESSVGGNPRESSIHRSSVASVVLQNSVVTINQSFLGEADELAVRDLASSFERSGGGETPARSALSLVLHRGDSALINPVDRGARGDFRGQSRVLRSVLVVHVSALVHEDFELFVGHVSELVESHLPAFFFGIMLVDNLDVRLENTESIRDFFRVILLAKLFLVTSER